MYVFFQATPKPASPAARALSANQNLATPQPMMEQAWRSQLTQPELPERIQLVYMLNRKAVHDL